MVRLSVRYQLWMENWKELWFILEGEYTKFWDTEFFNTTFGVNYTFR